jgi:type IV pilus assembly protein PilM
MANSKSILGIDLRATSVKVVEIEKGNVKNWGIAEVPDRLLDKHPQKEDAQAEALRRLIQEKKIKTKDAAVVVGGSDVYIKLYSLSGVSKAETAQAIKWKFAEEIPFAIEEAHVGFYPFPGSEESDYVAACVSKKLYREIEYVIHKAGLRLSAVTILPDALSKAFEGEISKEEDKIVSVIYMGRRTTNITILKNGSFEFNRELNIGGENITAAMSGVLVSDKGRREISPEEAEKLKIEHGVPVDITNYPELEDIPFTRLQAMVRPALENILGEIARTFEYYKSQTGEASIDKVFLTGGGAMTLHLADFLSEGLGIPAVTPETLEPRLSAAVGAALAGPERINLVPEGIKHPWKVAVQSVLKPQYAVSAFVALLAGIYLVSWLQANDIQALKLYAEKRTKMPKVFEEISRLVPRSVFVSSLHLTPEEIHLWGIAFRRGDTAENIISRYVLALASSSYFKEVKLLQAGENKEYVLDSINFEIVAKLNF